METPPTSQEIACQQVLVDDGSVFSMQWSVFPSAITDGLSPENLLLCYLSYIKRYTLSIIRPLVLDSGIEFRLFETGWSLISFLPPQADCESVTLQICGGLLVQPLRCDRGEFRFALEAEPAGVRVSLRLSEFYPQILGSPSPSRIRFWLYRLTQAAIHRFVAVRFLTLLYRERAGSAAAVQIINVPARKGQPV